jgi:hypothetical protein
MIPITYSTLEEEVSRVIPNQAHDEHIKSGFLMKKGEIFQRWRKRYFVLTARRLYYYSDKPSKPSSILKGVIDLHMVSIFLRSFCGVIDAMNRDETSGILWSATYATTHIP